MIDRLVVKGARQHNLRDVSMDIPRNAFVVVTGVSGSGKSSLAFNTVFAEGQRRYVESLSAYARQFLGQLDKPDVDLIEGLSPAVAIDQKGSSRNPRSTVGTVTEVYDYLRLLYARVGLPHCPVCGEAMDRQASQQIVDRLLAEEPAARIQVLAPVVSGRAGAHADLFSRLFKEGFSRVRVDEQVRALSGLSMTDTRRRHDVDVVVDRLVVKPGSRVRLADSIETALRISGGVVIVDVVDAGRELRFSERLRCPNDHPLGVDEFEPRVFSFNAPWGACPRCQGLGTRREIAPDLVVPDPSRTLAEGAIAPWASTSGHEYFTRLVEAVAAEFGFSTTAPWCKLPAAARKVLLHGTSRQVRMSHENKWGRTRSYTTRFEGVLAYLHRRYHAADSDSARERLRGYFQETPCEACGGARLNSAALAVTVGGLNIAQLTARTIGETLEYVRNLELDTTRGQIASNVLIEIERRLRFLLDVGLDYLSLDRPAGSLSGGEAQRIRLAGQIGAGLSGVLYVLDEPSVGLHQRDNERLIRTLLRLRDSGNTVVVVEHDEETIRAADWVVDVGPGAGSDGGQILHSGPVDDLLADPLSVTGAYLSGRRRIPLPASRRKGTPGREITVHDAVEHNLRELTVSFPIGLFTAVTGVSGSGKSTLVDDILHTALAKHFYRANRVPGRHRAITGIEHIDKVVRVDQAPIGRSPRSNPATYTGVFDHLRRLFAQTPEAKVRGYQPGRFSYNVKGGRCEACAGEGTLTIEMNFLPNVHVPCEVCHGTHYNRETLEVLYQGKSIADVLAMSVSEATEFFAAHSIISRHLRTLRDVGLGYLALGQSATTLSGGEAQRVKLAAELQRRSTGRTLYVLDEPTTGLHFADIATLLRVLHQLVDKGNTVIVIEHNLDLIATADWIIDLGPEGGHGGGTVVTTGPPEEVAAIPASHTGRYLSPLLRRRAATEASSAGDHHDIRTEVATR
ncbi:excinuclease ABC subunit UvrA [Amycolatopsis lurida]